MSITRLTTECIHCLIKKFSCNYPDTTSEKTRLEYTQGFMKILADAKESQSAPELVEQIDELKKNVLGITNNFGELKRHFNSLLLSMEEEIKRNIKNSNNPLKTAVKYAMMGNYIDFGAVDNVNEETLFEHISTAEEIEVCDEEFLQFENELKKAGKLTFLTDNCGEIVFDKILIEEIKNQYPQIEIKVIVRGFPVLNDVTIEDAKQVGLDKIVKVYENGSSVAGTCLDKISKEAGTIINDSDIIIAKGQGNFETMRGCKKNVYYIFMCKCDLFARRFNVPLYSGMFVNDLRIK